MIRFTAILLFLVLGSMLRADSLRIVSLAPALTEIVCYLGGEKNLVGRSSACDYPETVKNISAVGSFGRPEAERILALRPDWVIGNDLMNPNLQRVLKKNAVAVDFRQIENSNDYIFWVEKIGQKLRQEARAAEAVKQFRNEISQLQQAPALPLRALWVVNDKPIMVAGPGSLPDEALKLMKIKNAAAAVPEKYFKCSTEWLLTAPIDIIIWGLPGKIDRSSRIWGRVKAVQAGKIVTHAIDDPVTRPGPRFGKALNNLRKQIEEIAIAETEK